jgi:hypothetical protein
MLLPRKIDSLKTWVWMFAAGILTGAIVGLIMRW